MIFSRTILNSNVAVRRIKEVGKSNFRSVMVVQGSFYCTGKSSWIELWRIETIRAMNSSLTVYLFGLL